MFGLLAGRLIYVRPPLRNDYRLQVHLMLLHRINAAATMYPDILQSAFRAVVNICIR